MEKQNVTVSVPKDVLRKAKLLAERRRMSLSALIAHFLEQLVEDDEEYERARQQHMELMERGFDLGTYGKPPASRDELHERR